MTPPRPASAPSRTHFFESMAANRELLPAVLEVAQCLVVVLDRDGRIVMFNRYCEQCTGFSFDEVEGRYIWDALIRPQDRDTAKAVFADLASAEFPASHETFWLTRAGKARLVRWNNTVLEDVHGQAEYVVGAGLDITDSTGSRIKATEDEAKLRAILENVVEGVITIDTRGLMQAVNPAAERIFGYTAAEMIGHNVSMLMPAPHDEQHDRYIGRYLRTGEAAIIGIGREVEGRRKSGEHFPLELSVSEVNLGDHRLFTGMVRDISQRREIEESARRRLDEVAHSARLLELGEMAADLAHEVNQPLAAIASFAEASQRMAADTDGAPPALARALTGIASQAERASQIIRQLRKFARKDQARIVPVDVNAVVRGALELIDHEIRQDGVEVSLELDADLPQVNADKVQLEQILLNLIRNSLEAMRDRPCEAHSLAISSALDDTDSLEVRVTDSGPGLAGDMRERLFEMFHTSKPNGLGVGLAICRSIAEAHGGMLDVEHTSADGTTMRLKLPRNATEGT
ncbi:MAG: PAS domain-containing sensor histidine kinase [Gammaproteobacteria bacterium]